MGDYDHLLKVRLRWSGKVVPLPTCLQHAVKSIRGRLECCRPAIEATELAVSVNALVLAGLVDGADLP